MHTLHRHAIHDLILFSESGLTAVAIAAWSYWGHYCAIVSGGGIKCWGFDPIYWTYRYVPTDSPGIFITIITVCVSRDWIIPWVTTHWWLCQSWSSHKFRACSVSCCALVPKDVDSNPPIPDASLIAFTQPFPPRLPFACKHMLPAYPLTFFSIFSILWHPDLLSCLILIFCGCHSPIRNQCHRHCCGDWTHVRGCDWGRGQMLGQQLARSAGHGHGGRYS